MKKFFIIFCLVFCYVNDCCAQLVYEDGKLGFNLPIDERYATRWGGICHTWENATLASLDLVFIMNNVCIGAVSKSNRISFYSHKLGRHNDIMCQNILHSSDYSLKTNIMPLRTNLNSRSTTYGLNRYSQITDAVKSLNPVSFQWKRDLEMNGANNMQYGFIAQEVQQVFPDLVSDAEDGTLAVNYVALIPILTATIQELTDRIEMLEKRLNELEDVSK